VRDVLAPPTRPAAFNLIKARVPLRMTSKFLKTPSSAAPSAWPSAIVRHAAPAAPAAPQFQQAMDGAQVMQALLGMLQGQLQPPAPPPNDDINLRFFPRAVWYQQWYRKRQQWYRKCQRQHCHCQRTLQRRRTMRTIRSGSLRTWPRAQRAASCRGSAQPLQRLRPRRR